MQKAHPKVRTLRGFHDKWKAAQKSTSNPTPVAQPTVGSTTPELDRIAQDVNAAYAKAMANLNLTAIIRFSASLGTLFLGKVGRYKNLTILARLKANSVTNSNVLVLILTPLFFNDLSK